MILTWSDISKIYSFVVACTVFFASLANAQPSASAPMPPQPVSAATAKPADGTKDRFELVVTTVSTLLGAVLGAAIARLGAKSVASRSFWQQGLKLGIDELAAIDSLFIQQPQLWKYFFEGYEGPSVRDGEQAQTYAAAQRLLSHFAVLLMNEEKYPDIFGDWVAEMTKNRFARSPTLCRALLRSYKEYPISGRRQLASMLMGLYRAQRLKLPFAEAVIGEVEEFLHDGADKEPLAAQDAFTIEEAKNHGKFRIAEFLREQPTRNNELPKL